MPRLLFLRVAMRHPQFMTTTYAAKSRIANAMTNRAVVIRGPESLPLPPPITNSGPNEQNNGHHAGSEHCEITENPKHSKNHRRARCIVDMTIIGFSVPLSSKRRHCRAYYCPFSRRPTLCM